MSALKPKRLEFSPANKIKLLSSEKKNQQSTGFSSKFIGPEEVLGSAQANCYLEEDMLMMSGRHPAADASAAETGALM